MGSYVLQTETSENLHIWDHDRDLQIFFRDCDKLSFSLDRDGNMTSYILETETSENLQNRDQDQDLLYIFETETN